jgi:hypothetical protein
MSNMTLTLKDLKRGPKEDAFDEMLKSKELKNLEQIGILDIKNNTNSSKDNDMMQHCINCNQTSFRNMNRHFCSPECAISYFKTGPDLNPYKPKGGKTKRRRVKPNKKKHKWSQKYKKSINCRNPKGFSQKQYCKYGRKK